MFVMEKNDFGKKVIVFIDDVVVVESKVLNFLFFGCLFCGMVFYVGWEVK